MGRRYEPAAGVADGDGAAEFSGDLTLSLPSHQRLGTGYLLQSCAASAAQPLPDSPAHRQMYRAMLRATQHQRD